MSVFSRKTLVLIEGAALAVMSVAPVSAFAADPTAQASSSAFVPLTQLPQISTLATASSFPLFVDTLYKICIGAGSALAVIMIMVAGVQFMTSRGSVSSNEKAKTRIQNAVLGLILVLSPTIVFGIINPSILQLNVGNEFSGLALPANQTSTSATTNASASGNAGSCSTYATEKAANAGTSCSAVLTNGVSIDSSCCAGIAQGGVCCGTISK